MPENLSELKQKISNDKAVLVYFSSLDCIVCDVIKSKIEISLNTNFPNIKQIYINSNTSKEITSNYGIFSFPTILVFFEGNEFFRFSRNLSINEFIQDIKRPY